MAKQMNCPRCMAILGETVRMNPREDDYYCCPECGGEFWPGRADNGLALREIQEGNTYVSLSLQEKERVPGGGGSVGRAKKQGKKKTLAQINAELGGTNRGKNKNFCS